MNGTHLTGLEGTNPLAFLATLGVQVAYASESQQPRVWWSDGVVPHAVVDDKFTVERIAAQATKTFDGWSRSPAVSPRLTDGSLIPKGDELKISSIHMRAYLGQASQCGPAGAFITALLAEGSLDNNHVAKPSDLYFTAGNQKFLKMVRQILKQATPADVISALEGPWEYRSELPSLMWDVGDDRVYALRAHDPAPEKKRTNPGAEALAILGLSRHPVFAGRNRTLTQGCSGTWKEGWYSWPLWSKAASPNALKSLLAHAYDPTQDMQRGYTLPAWGISMVLRSPIRRSAQGGYGTFGPPEVAWQAS